MLSDSSRLHVPHVSLRDKNRRKLKRRPPGRRFI
jgi:hypothetical protein